MPIVTPVWRADRLSPSVASIRPRNLLDVYRPRFETEWSLGRLRTPLKMSPELHEPDNFAHSRIVTVHLA